MGKITFRADDDLVSRIEAMDASKSEVMRDALRAYFESAPVTDSRKTGSFDALITDRIDQRIDEQSSADVNITLTVEDDRIHHDSEPAKPTQTNPQPRTPEREHCNQCGESVDPDHVYCPNCGEKNDDPAVCECGSELRTDWAFCPNCGRRTPAADVLDR